MAGNVCPDHPGVSLPVLPLAHRYPGTASTTGARADAAGWLAGAGVFFHIGVAGAAMHAAWQLSKLDINDPENCLGMFRANRNFGLIIFAGALLDSLTVGIL